MVCRRFYYNLIIRVCGIALTSLALFSLLNFLPNISLLIITAALFIFQVVLLIRYLNEVNRRLEFFFIGQLSGEPVTLSQKPGRFREFRMLDEYFRKLNTRLEKMRLELEIQNNYFQTIVSQTSVGLIAYTGDGRVEFINDTAKNLLRVWVVRHLNRLDKLKEGFSQYLLKLEPEKTEMVNIAAEGDTIQLSLKKVRLSAGDQDLFLISFQDIRVQLDQKEMESWEKLVRVLMHEVGNSITPITTHVNAISRMFRERDTGRIIEPAEVNTLIIKRTLEALSMVESRGQRLAQFMANFRGMTKGITINKQAFNLRKSLDEIGLLFVEELKRQEILFSVHCSPELWLNADQNLLEQVLINMIKNSIEALDKTREKKIRISAFMNNDRTVIELEDNGKGIPDPARENIFVPFFTTKENGSGIGLSLSRQIITMHGGTLDFASVPYEKTVFTIRL